MSTVKRILGDYTISTVSADNTVGAGNVTVQGNLIVTGNTTIIESNSISTFDPTIQLNGNLTSSSAPFAGNSGLEVNRGSQSTAALYWNETVQAWQITSNVGNYATYSNILSSGESGGFVTSGTATQIGYYAATGDTISETGPNLTWNGSNLLSVSGTTTTTKLNSNNIVVAETSSTVTGQPGSVVIAANVAGQAGTGLYVNNTSTTDELVNKTKARKFSILFG